MWTWVERLTGVLLAGVLALSLGGCGQGGSPAEGGGGGRGHAAARHGPVDLHIVSGSENKSLEPIIQEFGRREGLHVQITYLGSVDISREIAKGTACAYDAVWPASSLWIALGDRRGVVSHAKSILRSPVVFLVKRPVAERLGWVGEDVTVSDILSAAEAGQLRFAMTSATQSNSGASAYLAYLTAFAGGPEVLTSEHLREPGVQDQIKRLLGRVDRSSGSSGWLMEMVLRHYQRFDAMVNYEALGIEANRELVARGDPPLYAVYPVDGLMIADSPLAYVNKGDAAREANFLRLQEYLLTPDVQQRILREGRRTGLVGMSPGAVDRHVFNPDWGIDIQRILSPIRTPAGPVVREALDLYQTAFRKPSLTAFVLDYSGSMRGEGERQLEEAMRLLLDPNLAAEYLLQPSARDVTYVIPFNDRVIDVWEAQGADPGVLTGLYGRIESQAPNGGTNMYVAATHAANLVQRRLDEGGSFHPAVIVMSDGKSRGSLEQLMAAMQTSGAEGIPIFTILFGRADEAQMEALAEETGGRMFDGRTDVVRAFRKAKGYN
jgi:Ca-activated chloride channel family protein